MASTSTGNGGNNKYVFDVFINHRGPDVKKTLATDLYNRLCVHGLRVFLDVEELQEGDEITPQIESAIRTSFVHIAIFSQNYAASSWCLNELLLMLESGSTILPIFYHIKPSELRWTLGTDGVFARALRTLEEKKTFDSQTRQKRRRYNSDTIAKWREALSKVAETSGFDLETYNGNEQQLAEQVVERVLKIVPKRLDVSKYPTGLDEKVKDFERTVLSQQQSREVRVIGIVGLGGVGKTTLAKEIFNRLGSNYKRSCFLFDVREKSVNSLPSLQSILLKDLVQQEVQISSADDGKVNLRRYLSSSHALIILDNVDHVEQLDALLLPLKDVLDSGSLILVTSRTKQVLTSSDIPESSIYRLTGLNPQHSRELFCSHAFGQPYHVVGFEEVTEEFLGACQGLPLSLKVIGALLRAKRELNHWKAKLRKISRILPHDIQSRLKISYDSLDEEEKQIFLDIACFFIREDRDTAIRIWEESGWEGSLGLLSLENKCLVEVDGNNHIRMHDHLRDLGRDIGEKESPHRLWRVTENLLPEKSIVRGINIVESPNENRAELGNRFLGIRGLDLVRAAGDCLTESIFRSVQSQHLIWLRWDSCPHSCLPHWIPMERLRVLEVEGFTPLKTLWAAHNFKAPLQLRELKIGPCLSEITKFIGKLKHLEFVHIDIDESIDLETLPDEFCHLESSKHLKLMWRSMKSLPDSFGNLTNLRHIDMSGCYELDRLPNSFGNLTHLQHINLHLCSK